MIESRKTDIMIMTETYYKIMHSKHPNSPSRTTTFTSRKERKIKQNVEFV